ncbi:hypothetical protein CQ12_06070 [Bradyrhizobium jicamae]|uniref:Uncharacterized protein n=1 Tax=Bradyrhizobium jicamae TaxID=280332 RepID=A0A0R3LPX5_9BRAD|nr:hypothetical protein [Bradyrhizobium jicamae]KRR09976.1 hypothetical protein CQ12_06070 [Bradyrhizobium jicamae]
MSAELDSITTGGNRKLVAAQLHHAERTGAGQVAAFTVECDRIAASVNADYDNLFARTGESVTTAKSTFATKVTACKTAATNAGKVEPPSAA